MTEGVIADDVQVAVGLVPAMGLFGVAVLVKRRGRCVCRAGRCRSRWRELMAAGPAASFYGVGWIVDDDDDDSEGWRG